MSSFFLQKIVYIRIQLFLIVLYAENCVFQLIFVDLSSDFDLRAEFHNSVKPLELENTKLPVL